MKPKLIVKPVRVDNKNLFAIEHVTSKKVFKFLYMYKGSADCSMHNILSEWKNVSLDHNFISDMTRCNVSNWRL